MSSTTQIELAPITSRSTDTDHRATLTPIPSATSQPEPSSPPLSRLRTAAMILTLAGVNFATSATNGLVGVALPAMTLSLSLPPSLAFWPASVSGLATASTLLLSGSLATAVGARAVDLAGCLACAAFTMGAAWVRSSEELVVLRALQGVALAMHQASSVAIVVENLPHGRTRNVAFSCFGLSQPLGYSFGLVLGGVFVDTVGWRAGWYLYGGITLVLAILGLWALPKHGEPTSVHLLARNAVAKVDWIGAVLASCSMACLSYVLAILSTDLGRIRSPTAISLLCVAVISLSAFPLWTHRQTRLGRPALIPNSIWRNPAFSCTCGSLIFSYAVVNSLEIFASLFFQNVQHLSALQASIRIVPSLTVSVLINLTIGLFVHKVPVLWLVGLSSLICSGAPVLMAVAPPDGIYWAHPFVAQIFQPASFAVLFTVGLIVVSDAFPEDTQALAGAVFNTAGQFGGALGLSVLQVVSKLEERGGNLEKEDALLRGYRASFWTMFGFMILCGGMGGFGMRKVGKVGLKRE